MLQKMLGNGWLTLQDLQNPEFGCGPLSARAYHEYGRHARRDGLRVLDRDGHGIDVALFHSGVIAKAGSFDFRQLNELCGTQIEADISPDVLAGFIEAGRVTRAQLETCVTPKPGEKDADPYVRRLQNLARAKLAGERTQRDVDVELEAVRREFEVKVKTAEKDFAGIEKKVREQPASSGLGFLSAKESAVLTRVRDYARDFAILNVGGHGLVLALRQPDISKALMPTRDFELLHRDDWVKVKDKDGRESVVYPAKEFLTTPPRNALFYRGGVVFRPSGTVAADQYNLYRGMLVAPDPSGSCSLLRKLIDEVWAQGDEPVTQWVMEYLMHIIAYPGQKIGTSIAIRGGYGDGKSIVFEKCLSTILGDMLLRVANHRVVLGDYNEAMMGKLVTVLEEATFVGDKGNFDKMKEIVTGEKILINPKFKAPMSVDNYSRLIVISNHDHFMYIKPGDRRYTVLESGPAWKNEPKKFDALVDQWNRGGAARFVYEALNHSFRRLPGRETLIINTNLDTSAAVRQMAQSRSGLEKCIVEFLLRGGLGDAMLSWTLRNPYNIPSWQLRQCVTGWLNEHDASSARHETALHLIIETLDKYAGVTDAERPKGARNLETGKRPQLPTIRRLPPRREAIEHAWRNNLITEAEYVFALPEIERPDETGAYRWQGSEESFDHISYPALWEMDDDDPG
jgi:hypothetical protein